MIKYGVTEPISLAKPTADDLKLTEELDAILRAHGLYESEAEALKREEVLGKIDVIVKEWVRLVSLEQGMSETLATEAGAKIYTFGSYRLGVHGAGADIDTLCVCPRHIDHKAFFGKLLEMLKSNPEVSEIQDVPDAFVPVIKMTFSGVEMDLLFARLAMPTVPDNLNLDDDNVLRNLDEKSILSINGSRVVNQILQLVPNVDNFRMALRAIKMWSKKRGIYGNAQGYLGGIAWAILVARICQLYPNAAPSMLVSRFFRVLAQWKWPAPVILKHIDDGSLGLRVWNPRIYPRDQLHLMPIVTPAYPCMNSTYNVSKSTLRVMKEEFERGASVCMQIEARRLSWEALFERPRFFTRYKHYIQVEASAGTTVQLNKWQGYIESRLRVLILRLEQTPNIEDAHLWPTGFPCTTGRFPHGIYYFFGLTFAQQRGAVDLTPAVTDFTTHVLQWPAREMEMDIRIFPVGRKNLPAHLVEQEQKACATSTVRPTVAASAPAATVARTESTPAAPAAVAATSSTETTAPAQSPPPLIPTSSHVANSIPESSAEVATTTDSTTPAPTPTEEQADTESNKRTLDESATTNDSKRAKLSPLPDMTPEDELGPSQLQKTVAPQTKRVAVRLAR